MKAELTDIILLLRGRNPCVRVAHNYDEALTGYDISFFNWQGSTYQSQCQTLTQLNFRSNKDMIELRD